MASQTVAQVLGQSIALTLGALAEDRGEPRELAALLLMAPDLAPVRQYVRLRAGAALGFPLKPNDEKVVKDFEADGRSELEMTLAKDASVWARRAIRAARIEQHQAVVDAGESVADLGFRPDEWRELKAALATDAKVPSVDLTKRIVARLGNGGLGMGIERITRAKHAQSEINRLRALEDADKTSDELAAMHDDERRANIERFDRLTREAQEQMASLELAKQAAGNAEAALRRVQEQMAKS